MTPLLTAKLPRVVSPLRFIAAVTSISRAIAPASRSFQKLLRVTLLPTVLIAAPIGAGAANVGAPCTSRTRVGATMRSSQRICARPWKEPCPMSDEPIVSVMLSSAAIVSQELTAVPPAACAASGKAMPSVKLPAAAPIAPSVPRKLRRSRVLVGFMGMSVFTVWPRLA